MPLRLLFPAQEINAPGVAGKVDIIAVHGLNPRSKPDVDHAWDTWRTPAGSSGRLWLRDDLPHYVPESRIFLYEYNATAVYGKDRDTFVGKANELLEAIRIERDGIESRPIIFLCHSMGGLLVKQALINAHNNPKHTPTKIATSGLAFFSTPHNGGDWKLVSLGGLAAKVATAAGFQKGDDVLETLKSGNIFSDIMQEHWRHQLLQYDIISFWGGLDNVVPRESARLGLPGDRENVVKLNADHRRVCKFGSSQTDQDNFKLVRGNIKDVYMNALKKISRQLEDGKIRTSEVAANRSMNQAIISNNGLPSRRPCHYVPLPKNTQFTGRDSILDDLKRKLFIEKECRKLAVVGLGGIGKTQVVLQLAYWVKETQLNYSVFWVPALSHGSFEQAYMEMARRLDIRMNTNDADPKDSVRRYLESERAGKWLLIVDNADDIEVIFGRNSNQDGVYKYLPESDHGLILYTTRSREVAVSVARSELVDLQQLSFHEAATLLQRAIVRPSILTDEKQTAELLAELCYLPLAITNAVAYLNQTRLPIRKYLDLLQGTEEDVIEMMTRESYDSSRYQGSQNAIAATWIVSFEQIAKSNPFAAELLSFVSCIEPKAIPQSLLPNTGLKSDMEKAIGTLCQYSFLTRRGASDTFDMHALVHVATRIWIRRHSRPLKIMTSALCHLGTIFPSSDLANRELWREYLPHALRTLERSNGYQIQDRYDLLFRVGKCLSVERRFKEAIKALEEARKRVRLTLEQDLKRSNQNGGRIKAMKLFKRVIGVRQKMLAEEHRSRLALEYWLANAYLDNRQIKEAIEILEHVVAVEKKILAEEDRSRLASEHALACAYLDNRQIKEATEILEHVVAVEKKTLAEEDHDRLASEHELASAYLDNRQIKEATEILEHVVAVQKKTLAEEDHSRLASEHELARAYLDNRQIKEPIELLEHVVAVQKKTLAEEDHNRLISEHVLAKAYLKSRRINEAIEILEHVVAIKKTMDINNKDRLVSQDLLTEAYGML